MFISLVGSPPSLTVILNVTLCLGLPPSVRHGFGCCVLLVLNASCNPSDQHAEVTRRPQCTPQATGGPGSSGRGCGWGGSAYLSDLGGHTRWKPLLENHAAFAPEVGLDMCPAAPGRDRQAACLGRFRPLGSELEGPHLSLR